MGFKQKRRNVLRHRYMNDVIIVAPSDSVAYFGWSRGRQTVFPPDHVHGVNPNEPKNGHNG